jgi:hypothetical protein
MVVAFEYERERRKYYQQSRDIRREPFFSASTSPWIAFAVLCLRLSIGLFERTQRRSANAMLVSRSASVSKLGRPNLAQYA